MIGLLKRWFAPGDPRLGDASPDDAGAFARLHAASFRRGWSEAEFEQLLGDRTVMAHRALAGTELAGFILSRIAAGEAEILSVAVPSRYRGRGIAGRLLALHLGRLAGAGTSAVFLEVDENNVPALRLYRRAGFEEVGRRQGYYRDPAGRGSAALVLRRELS